MAPQLLFIDQATGRVQAGNADTSAPLLLALQGTTLALRVGFVSEAIPGELPEGTTGRIIAKKELDHTGDPVLFDGAWTLDGDGTGARYEFQTLVDGIGLRTLLAGKAHVQLGVQIEWQLPDEDAPRKSQPFALHVLNSYAQEEDGVPDPATAAAWEWLKARLVQGTNITLTVNEDGKTITIASTGEVGGSVSWGDVSGKPETFPPSGHSHTTAELPMASQAEAEAGTNNSKLMTPLRVAQAIAVLAGGGGGSSITHRLRVFVDEVAGSDVTGLFGREDKPFATLTGAWTAWMGSEDYNVNQPIEIVLAAGEYNWTTTEPVVRARIVGAGAGLTACNIIQQAAAGASGAYGDPEGQGGATATLVIESDHSVYFDIQATGGDGGAAYYDPETNHMPGSGGSVIGSFQFCSCNGIKLKTGNRGTIGLESPDLWANTVLLNLDHCVVEGSLEVEVASGHVWSRDGDNLQIRASRVQSLTIYGEQPPESSEPLGFARLSEFNTGPVDTEIDYATCVGPLT